MTSDDRLRTSARYREEGRSDPADGGRRSRRDAARGPGPADRDGWSSREDVDTAVNGRLAEQLLREFVGSVGGNPAALQPRSGRPGARHRGGETAGRGAREEGAPSRVPTRASEWATWREPDRPAARDRRPPSAAYPGARASRPGDDGRLGVIERSPRELPEDDAWQFDTGEFRRWADEDRQGQGEPRWDGRDRLTAAEPTWGDSQRWSAREPSATAAAEAGYTARVRLDDLPVRRVRDEELWAAAGGRERRPDPGLDRGAGRDRDGRFEAAPRRDWREESPLDTGRREEYLPDSYRRDAAPAERYLRQDYPAPTAPREPYGREDRSWQAPRREAFRDPGPLDDGYGYRPEPPALEDYRWDGGGTAAGRGAPMRSVEAPESWSPGEGVTRYRQSEIDQGWDGPPARTALDDGGDPDRELGVFGRGRPEDDDADDRYGRYDDDYDDEYDDGYDDEDEDEDEEDDDQGGRVFGVTPRAIAVAFVLLLLVGVIAQRLTGQGLLGGGQGGAPAGQVVPVTQGAPAMPGPAGAGIGPAGGPAAGPGAGVGPAGAIGVGVNGMATQAKGAIRYTLPATPA